MGTKPEPWPIANALAQLREVRAREQNGPDTERAKTIELTIDFAIEVVKGINLLKEPDPPDPAREADKAIRAFCRHLGDAFTELGEAFAQIADEDTMP